VVKIIVSYVSDNTSSIGVGAALAIQAVIFVIVIIVIVVVFVVVLKRRSRTSRFYTSLLSIWRLFVYWKLLLFFTARHVCIARSYTMARCPFVRPSDTRRYSVEAAKDILKFFSSSDSQTILVFRYQTGWQYSDGGPP